MYKCPFCDKKKRKIADIHRHINDQHVGIDHWAKWIHGED